MEDIIHTKFKNWKNGGNNYLLHGNPKNRWVGFQKSVISILKEKFGTNFYLVIFGDNGSDDFWRVPYQIVEHLFIDEHMTKNKNPNLSRWTAIIEDNLFKMHSNSNYSVDVKQFYGKAEDISINYDLIDKTLGVDYTIEDAKALIKVRIGQSEFRKAVLQNFARKCCISGFAEEQLLVASHIVPWSKDKSLRSDPRNGLCLNTEIDSFFDIGYISVGKSFEVIITNRITDICPLLYQRLKSIEGKIMAKPISYNIKQDYLEYHRSHIFNTFK